MQADDALYRLGYKYSGTEERFLRSIYVVKPGSVHPAFLKSSKVRETLDLRATMAFCFSSRKSTRSPRQDALFSSKFTEFLKMAIDAIKKDGSIKLFVADS
ncbi:hypothetical protein OCU04_006303 [Sclerotinia nivalis]|uniref:Uncharacterized protein n=1 Tax=Sclerotinia nivalis TaxID=352851 RepID=A0A9X0DM18_9HELO|nr:hypothetical protein OCU04_006303 [Sclerotinia nivalis]